ncbi:hypothetical protein BJ322DRAFT_1000950 [Thelephora terrestris]|uniref:Uncharacterized protein n=1 Tax=Thelephora terrestris TaxID=56493 RepID=A0A9P6LAF1_9AGAM|nr:hypothetical protein BJ322DRAFT_1000950 [Thelephora terrestris]
MFVLDLLDNKPRLQLSDKHMKSILWALTELGVTDIPSLKRFQGMQKTLAEQINVAPHHHVSAMGNHFYQNSPGTLLAFDWANPLVHDKIRVYPEVTPKVTEFWQAGKWVDKVPPEELTPMWADWERDPDRHFYVGEIARTRSGEYVIPTRWVTFNGEEHAEVCKVNFNETVCLKN